MRRGIVVVYLMLFIIALVLSGVNLKEVIYLKPIPLIGLLKHTLLCVLFVILIVNAIKSLTLKPQHVDRFIESIKNFKWLFALALIIALSIKFIIGKPSSGSSPEINNLQLGVLFLIGVFCFWSDEVLRK